MNITPLSLFLLIALNFPTALFAGCIRLVANDATSDARFGISVGISGDRAIVGSEIDGDTEFGSGSAYLFDLATGSQTHKLLPTDGNEFQDFGRSVAISGKTAIVGARGDDDNGNNAGAVYLFDVDTGAQIAKLKPADGAPSAAFGQSVDIDGGVAIVGAYRANGVANRSGAAYLFDVTTGQEIAKLTASDGEGSDLFGWSVAIHNGIAIVGARNDDQGSGREQLTNAGSAFLFDVATGAELAKLTASDAASNDVLGWDVSIYENTALVGSGGSDPKALLFDVGTRTEIGRLTPRSDPSGISFGGSVALNDETAIVGEFLGRTAYLFDADTREEIVKLEPGENGISFGQDVAVSGRTVIIGAKGDIVNGINSGSAYVYTLVPEPHAGLLAVSVTLTLLTRCRPGGSTVLPA